MSCVSPTNAAVPSLVRQHCQRSKDHERDHDSAGGEPWEFCVYRSQYPGKKDLRVNIHPKVCKGEEEGDSGRW